MWELQPPRRLFPSCPLANPLWLSGHTGQPLWLNIVHKLDNTSGDSPKPDRALQVTERHSKYNRDRLRVFQSQTKHCSIYSLLSTLTGSSFLWPQTKLFPGIFYMRFFYQGPPAYKAYVYQRVMALRRFEPKPDAKGYLSIRDNFFHKYGFSCSYWNSFTCTTLKWHRSPVFLCLFRLLGHQYNFGQMLPGNLAWAEDAAPP